MLAAAASAATCVCNVVSSCLAVSCKCRQMSFSSLIAATRYAVTQYSGDCVALLCRLATAESVPSCKLIAVSWACRSVCKPLREVTSLKLLIASKSGLLWTTIQSLQHEYLGHSQWANQMVLLQAVPSIDPAPAPYCFVQGRGRQTLTNLSPLYSNQC